MEWHSSLGAFKDAQRLAQRAQLVPGVPPVIDESQWDSCKEFYTALGAKWLELVDYVDALALLAGIKEKKD